MPSLLERKDLLHQLARTAVDAGERNVAHEPAHSDHPLAKLAPNAQVVLPKPKPPESREEAERKEEQAADAQKAMERIASAYTEGHGARTAEGMLKDKGQPVPQEIQQGAKAEKKQQGGTASKVSEGSGELASFGKAQQSAQDQDSPAQQQQQIYTTVFPTLVCTGITNEHADARNAAQQLAGHGDDQHSLAAYDPQSAGIIDTARDTAAVKRYAHLAEQVDVDENGQVVMNYDRDQTYNRGVGIGGLFTTWYQSPAELGAVGADKLLSQMQGQGPGAKPPEPDQFISVQAHSGGGQSAFFTLVELHQRGFRNLSLVGYEMALTPHEREVLEKLGVQVTNLSAQNSHGRSGTGDAIRLGMGGGGDYYDAFIDRPGDNHLTGMHSMLPGDKTGRERENLERTTAMVQFTAWLDSQGLHQQWTPENYERFQQETGYTPSQNPLEGNNRYQPHTPAPAVGPSGGGSSGFG